MICQHCNHEIPDDSVFCPDCGRIQNLTQNLEKLNVNLLEIMQYPFGFNINMDIFKDYQAIEAKDLLIQLGKSNRNDIHRHFSPYGPHFYIKKKFQYAKHTYRIGIYTTFHLKSADKIWNFCYWDAYLNGDFSTSQFITDFIGVDKYMEIMGDCDALLQLYEQIPLIDCLSPYLLIDSDHSGIYCSQNISTPNFSIYFDKEKPKSILFRFDRFLYHVL